MPTRISIVFLFLLAVAMPVQAGTVYDPNLTVSGTYTRTDSMSNMTRGSFPANNLSLYVNTLTNSFAFLNTAPNSSSALLQIYLDNTDGVPGSNAYNPATTTASANWTNANLTDFNVKVQGSNATYDNTNNNAFARFTLDPNQLIDNTTGTFTDYSLDVTFGGFNGGVLETTNPSATVNGTFTGTFINNSDGSRSTINLTIGRGPITDPSSNLTVYSSASPAAAIPLPGSLVVWLGGAGCLFVCRRLIRPASR